MKMPTDKISIVSYNIGLGGPYMMAITENFENYPELKDADIVCLQEASETQGNLDAKLIAKVKGERFEYINVEAQKVHGKMQANAIIYDSKKLEFVSTEVIELPTLPTYLYLLYIPLIGKPKFDSRNCVIATFRYKDSLIRVFNTHLDLRGGWNLKLDQIHALTTKVQELNKADISIICGDLNLANLLPKKYSNHTRFEKMMEQELAELGFADVCESIDWTFHMEDINPRHRFFQIFLLYKKLGLKIDYKRKTDYIFARAGSRFVLYEFGKALEVRGSDHIPLFFSVKHSSEERCEIINE